MSASNSLGPFLIEHEIGKGGMGTVFRGRHRATGAPVAVKVLSPEVADDADKRSDFREEVQALARLNHPSIAAIVDYGEVDPDDHARLPAEFRPGTPWLAMEYVDGAGLSNHAGDWTWDETRRFLFRTLDALAHAHAVDIVHRDLSPSNVLVCADDTGESPVKLVDFGIARVAGPDRDSEELRTRRITGTPKYMAPEQIRGQWRDEGPWTDLYALGCITWWIVCRRHLFDGETTTTIVERQLRKSPEDFRPTFPVPDGLEAWLRALLVKSPDGRLRRAADAAWALAQLPEPSAAESSADRGSFAAPDEGADSPAQPTLGQLAETIREDLEATERLDVAPSDSAPVESTADGGEPSANSDPPPIPRDWRRMADGGSASPMPRAGLRLFGLRTIPVVDRDRERDQLWAVLRRVRDQSQPALALLEGGPGVGKSRLARWLCRRVHETGAARRLRISHVSGGGRMHGIRGSIRRTFRTSALDRAEVFERLREQLPALDDDGFREHDAEALTEWLRPSVDGAATKGPAFQFSSLEQTYAVWVRLLRRFARNRPLVVWLDDLQWGRETMGAVEYLFDCDDPPPVLVLATLQSDALVERRSLSTRIDEVASRSPGPSIELDPLEEEHHRALIDGLLDLEPQLADELADRTEGNPLFAVQLLKHWVDRGDLVAGTDGFRLADGVSLRVPDDIHAVWRERLERLVDGMLLADPDDTWQALEVAAALGREVVEREWRTACDEADIAVPDGLVDRLVERGLATRTEDGWGLAHGLLVESLEAHARRAERWERHHAACARTLEALYAGGSAHSAGRRADHWIEAGRPAEALAPLLTVADQKSQKGEYDGAERILERRRHLLESLDIPPDDRRYVEHDLERALLTFNAGSTDAAVDRLDDVIERADANGFDRLHAKARLVTAKTLIRRGRPDDARCSCRRGLEWLEELDAPRLRGRGFNILGWTHMLDGDFDRARTQLTRARTHFERAEYAYGLVKTGSGLGWIAFNRSRDDRARKCYQRAMQRARSAGFRLEEAQCWFGLGDLARYDGHLAEARDCVRRAQKRIREAGYTEGMFMVFYNFAQISFAEGEYADAALRLDRAEETLERVDAEVHRTDLAVSRLAVAAGRGDEEEVARHLEPFADGLPEETGVSRDHCWTLEIAGDRAVDDGRDEIGRTLWRLAREGWQRLGHDTGADRVDRKRRGA